MLDEQRDVAAALAQRRHVHADDREAVVEVLAERLLRDLGAQVAVGRGDDAHVDLLVRVGADLAHRALVEHAQQRRLQVERQLADLVEEDRAAVGLGEGAACDR